MGSGNKKVWNIFGQGPSHRKKPISLGIADSAPGTAVPSPAPQTVENPGTATVTNTPRKGDASASLGPVGQSPALSRQASFGGAKPISSTSTDSKSFNIRSPDSAMEMISPTTTTTMPPPKRFYIPDYRERQNLSSSLTSTSTGKSTEIFNPTPNLQDKLSSGEDITHPTDLSSFSSNISFDSKIDCIFEARNHIVKNSQMSPRVSFLNWRDMLTDLVKFTHIWGVPQKDVLAIVFSIYGEDQHGAEDGNIDDIESEENQQSSDDWYHKGNEYARINQHEAALDCYRNALKYGAPKPQYYNQMALSCAYLGYMELANTNCQKILRLDPNYAEVHKTYGVICRYQYAKSKAQGDWEMAEAYNIKYHEHLSQYRKFIHNDPKKEAICSVEQSLMSVVAGKLNEANEYLQDGKKKFQKHYDSIKKNTHHQISIQEREEYKAKVTLIDKVTLCIQESKPHFSFGRKTKHSDQLSPEILLAVEEALRNLTESAQQKQLDECTQNIKKLQEECVTRPEVSVAVENNPVQLRAKLQTKTIEENRLLTEYFDALVATITIAVESARVIVDENVEVGKTTITMATAKQLLSWIPVWGSAVAGITSAIGESVQELNIKNAAKRLCPIARDMVDLHNKVWPAAQEITLSKKDQILSPIDEQKEKSFFTKIFTKLDHAMQSAASEIYVKLYNTPAGLLGHKDGCKIVTQWIDKQKALEKISESQRKPMSNADIIVFMKAAIIPDYQDPHTRPAAVVDESKVKESAKEVNVKKSSVKEVSIDGDVAITSEIETSYAPTLTGVTSSDV